MTVSVANSSGENFSGISISLDEGDDVADRLVASLEVASAIETHLLYDRCHAIRENWCCRSKYLIVYAYRIYRFQKDVARHNSA
jgi:hypothetical protein